MKKIVFALLAVIISYAAYSQSSQIGSVKTITTSDNQIQPDSTTQTRTDNSDIVSPVFRRITPDFDRSAIEIDTTVASEFFRVMESQRKENTSVESDLIIVTPLFKSLPKNTPE